MERSSLKSLTYYWCWFGRLSHGHRSWSCFPFPRMKLKLWNFVASLIPNDMANKLQQPLTMWSGSSRVWKGAKPSLPKPQQLLRNWSIVPLLLPPSSTAIWKIKRSWRWDEVRRELLLPCSLVLRRVLIGGLHYCITTFTPHFYSCCPFLMPYSAPRRWRKICPLFPPKKRCHNLPTNLWESLAFLLHFGILTDFSVAILTH